MEPNLIRYIWRHSRREQLLILGFVAASLPFYWMSLEIPKRIVNDAIQGRAFETPGATALFLQYSLSLPDWLGGYRILSLPGWPLHQIAYLFALSCLFLALVLVNGWFKYVINIRKGILGERMLRRMRFDLFALLMRFRPEDIRAVKPAEAASMIKDEVDPIGGFIGDAFIQPAFLSTQALTALLFIVMQNYLMGLVALAIVLVQAVIIPKLRVEQLRLGRERQLVSRQLAGRIGELVDGAPALHGHGVVAFSEADIGARLGRLYHIRVDLFRRKFAVKYLNNILAQITPFFFYAIGGYFAIKGRLDIGQLVAVIAAYRDLPPPIKELIDWDQQRNDVTLKYEQVVHQFSPNQLLPLEASALAPPAPDAPIVIRGLRVGGGRGGVQLERMTTTIERPSHVAIAGTAGGRDVLPKVLGRLILGFQGTVSIGDTPIGAYADATAARFIGYCGVESSLFPGSIRDNILFALRRATPAEPSGEALTPSERWRIEWARDTGNPTASIEADWLDYAAAEAEGAADLDERILAALEVAGMKEDVYRLGLNERLAKGDGEDLKGRLVAARALVRARLEAGRMSDLIEPFDPDRYNDNSTIAENLLFGVSTDERFATSHLAGEPYVRSILESEALTDPLTQTGLRIAQSALEIFGHLPAGHPMLERFPLISSTEMDAIRRIVATAGAAGVDRLTEAARSRLLSIAFAYVEPRYRMGALDDLLRIRILRARRSLMRYLPVQYARSIEFYDPGKFMTAAPIVDNLLFGRVGRNIGNAERKVADVLREALVEAGLLDVIYGLGLDFNVGVGGRLASSRLRLAIDLARSLIKRPQILILDGPLTTLDPDEAQALAGRLRARLRGGTLIAVVPPAIDPAGFDRVIRFEGPAMLPDDAPAAPAAVAPSAA